MTSSAKRTSTPLTDAERAELGAFMATDSPEYEALVAMAPISLHGHSEGSTMRALVVLGMRYVRERLDMDGLATRGYDELARERASDPEETDVASFRRRNMRRLAATDKF